MFKSSRALSVFMGSALSVSLFILGGCESSYSALASPPAAAPARFERARFQQVVTRLAEEYQVKGLVGTVWVGNEKVTDIALGESLAGVPASTEMTVRLGGISQTFAGTLVMRLVDQGRLDLDEPVARWLPDLPHADKVTVGMLAGNTAGYKDYVLSEQFAKDFYADPFRSFSADELIAYAVADGEMNFPPGTSQRYSHTEWTILEQVIVRATGQSMPELYQREIFTPLGLTRTGYSTTPELPGRVFHAFSSDREIYEDSTYWNPSWVGGSGPLYSTLDDVGRWGHHFGRGTLLTGESLERLTARSEVAPVDNPYYATGFGVGNGWYYQNPAFNGYSGAFGHLPDQDLTIVLFASSAENTTTEKPAFTIFKETVAELFPDRPLP